MPSRLLLKTAEKIFYQQSDILWSDKGLEMNKLNDL